MHNTHFDGDCKSVVKKRAQSYVKNSEGEYIHFPLSFSTTGATSLNTTIDDLILWDTVLRGKSLFSSAFLKDIFTKATLNSGEEIDFGFVISFYKGQRVIRHNGCDAGFRAHMAYFPELDLSLWLLSGNGSINAGDLVQKVAELICPDEFTVPKEEQEEAIILSDSDIEKRASTYYSDTSGHVRTLEYRDNKLFLKPGPGPELEPLSEELNVSYDLIIKEDHLCLCWMKQHPRKLIPFFKEGFIATPAPDPVFMISLVFYREKGRVAGFRLTSLDVRKLHFVKV